MPKKTRAADLDLDLLEADEPDTLAEDAEPLDLLEDDADFESAFEQDDPYGGDSEEDELDFAEQPYELTGLMAEDAVGLYLKEMASVSLLSFDEEVRLAQAYELGLAAQRSLDVYLDGKKPFAEGQQATLLATITQGCALLRSDSRG
jgi:hypothetical protein